MTKSCADIRVPNYIRNNYMNNNTIYRYSVNIQKYIYENETFNQNYVYKNQFQQNDNNTYNNIVNNKNMNIYIEIEVINLNI